MDIQLLLVVFVFGLVFGSFFNVVALRTLKGEKLDYPPSHCVNCNHNLAAKDLVPVFSWLYLRGKCRYCKEKISPIYPFVEFLTGVSYTLIVYEFGFTLETFIQIIFITIMMIATSADLKEKIIPDRFFLIGLALVLILRIVKGDDLGHYLLSSAIAFGVLLLILLLSKGRMGGADVKLYALIGLSIGWVDSLGSLFYASFVAVAFYIVMNFINKKGKITGKTEIPFVPFITIGVLMTYFLPYFKFM